MTPRCPICRKQLDPAPSECGLPAFHPFCSNRCKLVDLNAWLEMGYRIDDPSNAGRPDELPADFG